MRIALLNDPNNFHTQKWAAALEGAGAHVTVFSFDEDRDSGLTHVQLPVPGGGPNFDYRAYLRGGPALAEALDKHQIDLLNALNVTPFGVLAARSRFRPFVASAIGADLLEYPPRISMSPVLRHRSWSNPGDSRSLRRRIRQEVLRRYYRRRVAEALTAADLVTGDNQQLVDAAVSWFGIDPAQVRLLRWGVEPDMFAADPDSLDQLRQKLGIAEGMRVLLSPRGAKPVYHGETILEAFAQLLEGGLQDKHLLMLSAGYEIPAVVTQKAKQLESLYPNFSFFSEVLSRGEAHALWNLVDLFISTPAYDGYSAALAEGRFIGAIPLVNDIPAHRELIRHQENGWVIAETTAGEMAGAIQAILPELEKWKAKFAPPNRAWIEEHSLLSRNADLFMGWAEELLTEGETGWA